MCVSMHVLGHTCESQKAMVSSQFSTATFEVGYLLFLTLLGYSRSANSWGQADPPVSTLKDCNSRCVTIHISFFFYNLGSKVNSDHRAWKTNAAVWRNSGTTANLTQPILISCSTRIIHAKEHGGLCIVRTDRNNHAGNSPYLSTKRRVHASSRCLKVSLEATHIWQLIARKQRLQRSSPFIIASGLSGSILG